MWKKLSAAYILFMMLQTIAFGQEVINNGIERPKLVVGLVIDQMRWDYLYRYYNRYGEGGFRRLLKKGYSFENTFIPYTPTVTAAGHTCLYTGTVPAINGIVGNDWIERDSGKRMYCTQDKSEKSVGTTSWQGEMSPRNMLTTTIGDELRLATNFKSRVYGIALKDRGGILPAGHSANAAYWFDDVSGNWITSTYYMPALPAWVNDFNSRRTVDSMLKNDWTLINPLSEYDQSTDDDKMYEKTFDHEKTRTFPHLYNNVSASNYFRLRQSPYGNTLTFDFAKQLIESEKLGSTGQTDMLCVSISSTDYIGHKNGPNSLEIEDTYLRLDKEIEQFLNYLDKAVGKKNYLLFLSADHGAPQIPGFMKENKLPAGNLYSWGMIKEMNKIFEEKYHAAGLVQAIFEYEVYLDTKKIDSLKLDFSDVKKTVISFLKTKPEVTMVFDYADFNRVILPAKEREQFANGYFVKRSGDIQFRLKPQYTDVDMSGTEHGTGYTYDTHIPLLWYGWNIQHGKTNREVYMTDVAPTIAAMLRIQMPNGTVGKVLEEVVNGE